MAPPAPIGVWGPVGWRTLHDHAWFFYVEQPTADDRRNMKSFLDAYAAGIPCPACRRHFSSMLARDVPTDGAPALSGNDALFAATVAWHNEVNERKGKPLVALRAARARMERRASGSSAQLDTVFSGLALASVVLLAFAFASFRRKVRPRIKANAAKRRGAAAPRVV